jgi:hypothetical protein
MKHLCLLLGLAVALPVAQCAEEPAPGDQQIDQQQATGSSSDNAVTAHQEGKLSRWFDLDTLSFSLRYRSTDDKYGTKLFQFGQQRSLIDGKLKLDSEAKYTVNFHISSGRYFNWAYADEIGGSFSDRAPNTRLRLPPALALAFAQAKAADTTKTNSISRGWEMYVRQLYLSASPVKQLTFEFGSMPIEHGVNTEMTTYDDDGYMEGGRVRLKDPDHLFFDQLTATFGYLGDIYLPNLFDRGNRFSQSNYHQFLIEKKLTGRLDASIDWTEHIGTHTWREALLVKTGELKVLDSARLELYQRTNDIVLSGERFAGGNGFGITAAKDITKQWHIEGGYASIDRNYAVYNGSRFLTVAGHSINGDAYAIGNRFFARASYKPTRYFSLFGYATHIVNTNFMTLNGETYYGGAEINLKNIINDKFHLF